MYNLEATDSQDNLSCIDSYTKQSFTFQSLIPFFLKFHDGLMKKHIKIMHAIQACNPTA